MSVRAVSRYLNTALNNNEAALIAAPTTLAHWSRSSHDSDRYETSNCASGGSHHQQVNPAAPSSSHSYVAVSQSGGRFQRR